MLNLISKLLCYIQSMAWRFNYNKSRSFFSPSSVFVYGIVLFIRNDGMHIKHPPPHSIIYPPRPSSFPLSLSHSRLQNLHINALFLTQMFHSLILILLSFFLLSSLPSFELKTIRLEVHCCQFSLFVASFANYYYSF